MKLPLVPPPTQTQKGEIVISYYTDAQMYEYGKKVLLEERARCALVAEMYPFSPHVGKGIAAAICEEKDD